MKWNVKLSLIIPKCPKINTLTFAPSLKEVLRRRLDCLWVTSQVTTLMIGAPTQESPLLSPNSPYCIFLDLLNSATRPQQRQLPAAPLELCIVVSSPLNTQDSNCTSPQIHWTSAPPHITRNHSDTIVHHFEHLHTDDESMLTSMLDDTTICHHYCSHITLPPNVFW